MRLGEESYPIMEWQSGWICEVRIPSPHPMSRIMSDGWGNSQDWIVLVSCGTKDADVEYASAVQGSSDGVWLTIDIFPPPLLNFLMGWRILSAFFFKKKNLVWVGRSGGTGVQPGP